MAECSVNNINNKDVIFQCYYPILSDIISGAVKTNTDISTSKLNGRYLLELRNHSVKLKLSNYGTY